MLRKIKFAAYLAACIVAAFSAPAFAQQQGDGSLPLGDDMAASGAARNYLYTCRTRYMGGTAYRDGPWIVDRRWYPMQKPFVRGSVSWNRSVLSVLVANGQRLITSNGNPKTPTGVFPILPSDPVFEWDHNPYVIVPHLIRVTLPANPELAPAPYCVPFGMIGILSNGIPLYSAVDGGGRDALAHDMHDACGGHPEMRGDYHFHGWSNCLNDFAGRAGRHSDLVGYALDGFGIYGPVGENGRIVTNDDLDECHGHTHVIDWDGKPVAMYHYHFTAEYPYSVGCFRGVPVTAPNVPAPGSPVELPAPVYFDKWLGGR